MAISDVRICNMALANLGAGSILALTENSENARKCNMIYEQERDDLLSIHRWNFATNRATLARLATAPAYGYDHQYQLPSDCLQVLEMKEEREEGVDWHIEGRALLTNSDTALIKYTQRITDPTYFSKPFVGAFVARLSALLAISVSNSRALSEHYWAVYDSRMGDARLANAIEGQADEDDKPIETSGSWIADRG